MLNSDSDTDPRKGNDSLLNASFVSDSDFKSRDFSGDENDSWYDSDSEGYREQHHETSEDSEMYKMRSL